jgi:hypothetical protein
MFARTHTVFTVSPSDAQHTLTSIPERVLSCVHTLACASLSMRSMRIDSLAPAAVTRACLLTHTRVFAECVLMSVAPPIDRVGSVPFRHSP